MAYCDYFHCANCDCKVFYDADVNYEFGNIGEIIGLCEECSREYKIYIFKRGTMKVVKDVKYRICKGGNNIEGMAWEVK